MTANSSRLRALQFALAPTSMSTVRPEGWGRAAARAGRSTSSRVPSTSLAMVQQAAVLPAEKNASAAGSRPGSTATVMEERFLRVARVTFSPIPTASAASTIWMGASPACARRNSSATTPCGPTSTTWRLNSRQAATAPSTTTRGPRSPPIASTATRGKRADGGTLAVAFASVSGFPAPLDLFHSDDLLALVVPALRADPVRELGLVAVRTEGQSGRLEVIVGAAHGRAGLGMTALGIRHERFSSAGRPGLQRRAPCSMAGGGRLRGSLAENLAEGCEPLVHHRLRRLAIAASGVAVHPAGRAQPAAVLTAQATQRQGQVHLLAHHLAQVDAVMVVVGDDHVAVRELDLLLLLVGVGLSPARHEEQVEILVELFHERFQAPPPKEAQPRLHPPPAMHRLVFPLFSPPPPPPPLPPPPP